MRRPVVTGSGNLVPRLPAVRIDISVLTNQNAGKCRSILNVTFNLFATLHVVMWSFVNGATKLIRLPFHAASSQEMILYVRGKRRTSSMCTW